MTTIVITHNTPEVMAQLGKLPGYVSVTLDRAMGTGAGHLTRAMREKAPKAETELTNAIQPARISLLEWHVRAAKAYASHVEDGTKPGGRPSLDRMIRWITRKGISPRGGMSVRSLAHLMRRRIAQKGNAPQPYAQPALEEQTPRLDSLFRAAVTRGLAAINEGRAL